MFEYSIGIANAHPTSGGCMFVDECCIRDVDVCAEHGLLDHQWNRFDMYN